MLKPNVFQCGDLVYLINKTIKNKQDLRQSIRDEFNCNECVHRMGKLCGFEGPNGPIYLQYESDSKNTTKGSRDWDHLLSLKRLYARIVASHQHGPESVFLIGKNSFPREKLGDREGIPFYHYTIKPTSFTKKSIFNKMEPILDHYMPIYNTRFEKLFDSAAIEKTKAIISDIIPTLERPDHWSSLTSWLNILYQKLETPYSELSEREKLHFAVFAFSQGRSDGGVHFDFQQSSNILDFVEMDVKDIGKEMDKRSNPNTYMVTQLSKRMNREKITSSWTVSLVWDGVHTDDLDLHVKPEGYPEIYYGHKSQRVNGTMCRLDFDANVSRGEKEPCENISLCPCDFTVYVNNYSIRSKGDVPFTVIIHQENKEDMIIEKVWTRTGPRKMFITKWRFTHIVSEPVEISKGAIGRSTAFSELWKECTDDCPRSVVPCIDTPIISSSMFDYYLRKKPDKIPETVQDISSLIKQGGKVYIDPRNFSPGYVTEIITKTQMTKYKYTSCHYQDNFSLPVKVTSDTKLGKARLTSEWFSSGVLSRSVRVLSLDPIEGENKRWFMTLEGARLPENTAGGFYAQDLNTEYFNLRDRWTFCHSTIKPTIDCPEGSSPMIGSFLVGNTSIFSYQGINLEISNTK